MDDLKKEEKLKSVTSPGIEPRSQEPESCILSIKL